MIMEFLATHPNLLYLSLAFLASAACLVFLVFQKIVKRVN